MTDIGIFLKGLRETLLQQNIHSISRWLSIVQAKAGLDWSTCLQTTTQPVCLSCRHSVYLSQRWSVFLSAGQLVCLMLCYLKRHAGKMTSNLKGQCHRNILHLFNIANYKSLFVVELYYVSKEITCKWQNLCFVF